MKAAMVALVVICGSALCCHGQESGMDSVSALKIRGLEYSRFQARVHGDNHVLDAIFDNALVLVEYDGTLLTKAAYLSAVRTGGSKVLEITAESMTIQLYGNTASVVGIYRERGVKDGQPYLRRGRFIDTWTGKNGDWVCVASAVRSLAR